MEYVFEIATGILLLWLSSMEIRTRAMSNKVQSTMEKQEVENLINLKQESLRILQSEIKDDIKRLENKLDQIEHLLIRLNGHSN